jgi:ribonuclease Z
MAFRTAMLVLVIALWCSLARAQDFKVTLLGTGSPFPDPNRFSAATLVEAGRRSCDKIDLTAPSSTRADLAQKVPCGCVMHTPPEAF